MFEEKTTKIIKQDSTVFDAVKLILDTARSHSNSRAVNVLLQKVPFDPNDIMGWFARMFWYIDSLVKYQYDVSGREQISTPDRLLLKDKFGDCDDYATLWAAILNKLKVKHYIKIVKYDSSDGWKHVYVTVPKKNGTYITIDNVVGKFERQFNREVKHKESKSFNSMDTIDLQGILNGVQLQGMGCACRGGVNGLQLESLEGLGATLLKKFVQANVKAAVLPFKAAIVTTKAVVKATANVVKPTPKPAAPQPPIQTSIVQQSQPALMPSSSARIMQEPEPVFTPTTTSNAIDPMTMPSNAANVSTPSNDVQNNTLPDGEKKNFFTTPAGIATSIAVAGALGFGIYKMSSGKKKRKK